MALQRVKPVRVVAQVGRIWEVAVAVVAVSVAPVPVIVVVAAEVLAWVAEVVVVVATNHPNPIATEKKMNFKYTMNALAIALLVAATPLSNMAHAAPSVAQQSFATPEEAGKALADALRAKDVNALLAVVGPKSRSWLSSGDEVADRQAREKFLSNYDRKHAISESSEGKAFLLAGEDDWPFPAPLVKKANGWVFDSAAGREELLNRRVGANELGAIQTLLATVDAQREYAVGDLDGNGFNDYAQRFISTPGKRDGLFWPVSANEPLSPLGPLIGLAAREGYGKKSDGKPVPYHGYHFRMLTGQGKSAPGGAYSYLANGKMIGGFAAVAYPAKYGVSGVMTFVVSHDATVYQKNLGKNTQDTAVKMRSFSPDSSWTKVQ
jgi:hypothetical protein